MRRLSHRDALCFASPGPDGAKIMPLLQFAYLLQKLPITLRDVVADFRGAEIVAGAERQSNFMFDKEADGKRHHDAARANSGFAIAFATVAVEVADTDEALFPRGAALAANHLTLSLMKDKADPMPIHQSRVPRILTGRRAKSEGRGAGARADRTGASAVPVGG